MKVFYIVPDEIVKDPELNANHALLYGIIIGLTGKEGYCYAKNEYFESLLKMKERSIQNHIQDLEDHGYIYRKYVYKIGSKQIQQRLIFTAIDIKGVPNFLHKRGGAPECTGVVQNDGFVVHEGAPRGAPECADTINKKLINISNDVDGREEEIIKEIKTIEDLKNKVESMDLEDETEPLKPSQKSSGEKVAPLGHLPKKTKEVFSDVEDEYKKICEIYPEDRNTQSSRAKRCYEVLKKDNPDLFQTILKQMPGFVDDSKLKNGGSTKYLPDLFRYFEHNRFNDKIKVPAVSYSANSREPAPLAERLTSQQKVQNAKLSVEEARAKWRSVFIDNGSIPVLFVRSLWIADNAAEIYPRYKDKYSNDEISEELTILKARMPNEDFMYRNNGELTHIGTKCARISKYFRENEVS